MIESPLLQEIVAEAKHDTILKFISTRFGPGRWILRTWPNLKPISNSLTE